LAAELGDERRALLHACPDAEARLVALVADARRAWPELALPPLAFLRYAIEHVRVEDGLDAALAALHGADLYLACGCVRGDERALALFEQHFLADVAAYLSQRDALSDFSDEVKQTLRQRLFVGADGLTPRIASYSGRGPLKAWLRMAMTRAAIDLRRRVDPAAPVADPEALPEPRTPGADPELAYLKEHYRRELGRAMRATLAALSDRESNVLWLRYYQGLSAEAIGHSYRVSARTVQRWLDGARARLLKETHKLLAERLRVEPSEIRQLIQLGQSQLEVSFSRILRRSV
jgi:RNA polymerase sigma-70 factor (ECF subfamily)